MTSGKPFDLCYFKISIILVCCYGVPFTLYFVHCFLVPKHPTSTDGMTDCPRRCLCICRPGRARWVTGGWGGGQRGEGEQSAVPSLPPSAAGRLADCCRLLLQPHLYVFSIYPSIFNKSEIT